MWLTAVDSTLTSLVHVQVCCSLSSLTNVHCFRFGSGLQWSEDGCRVVSTSATRTECSCSHLTSFAILMHPSRAVVSFQTLKRSCTAPTSCRANQHVMFMCSLCSAFCLFLHTEFPQEENTALGIATKVGLCISIVCLLVTVVIMFGVK